MPATLQRSRELYFLLTSIFGLAALVIWIRTATVKDTYLYVQHEKEYRRLQQDLQSARVRWLKLSAPDRLEGLARVLGLGPARPNQVLEYESEPRKK